MLEPKVIYEDENFLAVNKPAGLLVHSVPSAKSCASAEDLSDKKLPSEKTLVDWLLKKYPEIKDVGDHVKLPDGNHVASPVNPAVAGHVVGGLLRPGVVHRLDKDTSGVMVVAKNQKTFYYLKGLFQNREIKKTYLALVWGGVSPSRGTINKPIALKSGTTKHTTHKGRMEKEAVTEYRVLGREARSVKHETKDGGRERDTVCTLLEVYPKTGRTHQIRVHLASIGHPVVGDKIYGPKKLSTNHYSPTTSRLMLHALSLEFTKEDGSRIKLEAEPPQQFTETINSVF